ncbi:hypothetical protein BYT42DRAFT_581701 [Radiomyces spectabilis]|nr:hypothetical protein BYT42DRAFT_581701 [Radiomyces spectabilis]
MNAWLPQASYPCDPSNQNRQPSFSALPSMTCTVRSFLPSSFFIRTAPLNR